MNENEILAEIRHIREEHARECGYDVHTLFEQMRLETAQLAQNGWRIASPPMSEVSFKLREEPPV